MRPGRQSRPRTKRRPDYSNRPRGRVVGVDRGRFAVALDDGCTVQAVKARELARGAVVIGDFVRVTGDVSGRPDTLARVAHVEERTNVLRRSLEEADSGRGEKIIVANVDLMVIVTAAADPQPRTGMVERCLVAADEAGVPALLCITKTDLADPTSFVAQFAGFELGTVETDATSGVGLATLEAQLHGRFSVLVGHSGVGKSTLINALIPDADRAVGQVSDLTGKGRHTSTNAVALPLPAGGWLVDTPGVRSFGLAHAGVENVLAVFPELEHASQYCLPNCTHLGSEADCALDLWAAGTLRGESGEEPQSQFSTAQRRELLARARSLLAGMQKPSWQ